MKLVKSTITGRKTTYKPRVSIIDARSFKIQLGDKNRQITFTSENGEKFNLFVESADEAQFIIEGMVDFLVGLAP